MKLWTYTLREAQKRPGRTLLTVLGITLGLATVVATRLTVHTIHRAYRELFEEVAGPPALEVTALGQEGFQDSFSATLKTMPGIKTAVPRIQAVLAATGKSGRLSVPMLGTHPAQIAAWPLREGRPLRDDPEDDNEVVLDFSLATTLGVKAGDRLPLWSPTGPSKLLVAGILEPRGQSLGRVIMSLSAAQRLFDLAGKVSSVELRLADDADVAGMQAKIAGVLPARLTVQKPGQRGELARSTMFATEQGLDYLSLVALVAAAFVVFNTFMLNLGERRPQLAVLRSLGATRGQIMRLLLRETAVFALVGTVAGWLLGVALTHGLLYIMAQFAGLALPPLQWSASPFVLTLLLGPGLALAAAWLPTWCASRRQPLDELRPPLSGCGKNWPPRICRIGLVLLLLAAGIEFALAFQWLPATAGTVWQAPALGLLVAAGVLTLPLVIMPLLRALETLPLGLECNLALKLLARRPARTALTAGVLFLALTVAIGFGQAIEGIVQDLRRWYGETIVADFLVRSAMPDTAFTLTAEMPSELGHDLDRLANVAAVDKLSFVPCLVNNRPVLMLARTFVTEPHLPLDLQEGEAVTVRAALRKGDVVLGTNLAQELGVHRGDTITLQTAQGPKTIRIAGTATEYAAGGLILYMEWRTARALLRVPGVNCFLIGASPGARAAAGAGLQAFCNEHNLLLQSNAEMRGQLDALLQRVVTLLWALLALAFLVASLGVANTLTMNVQDQTRDFSVLRALGLKRKQISRVVLAQALLLACLGLLPGALAGGALAYVINLNCYAWGGHTMAFHPDLLIIGGCWILTLGTALAASFFPAWKAVRMPVIQGLH